MIRESTRERGNYQETTSIKTVTEATLHVALRAQATEMATDMVQWPSLLVWASIAMKATQESYEQIFGKGLRHLDSHKVGSCTFANGASEKPIGRLCFDKRVETKDGARFSEFWFRYL